MERTSKSPIAGSVCLYISYLGLSEPFNGSDVLREVIVMVGKVMNEF